MSDTIAIASDHAGVDLKAELAGWLREQGFEVLDLGPADKTSVDYPDFGHRLAQAVSTGEAARGIAICGTGIGIGIAVNRHAGVRGALCTDTTMARLSREHNDANVLVLGARIIGPEIARDCLRVFLATPFEGGRHARRVGKLG